MQAIQQTDDDRVDFYVAQSGVVRRRLEAEAQRLAEIKAAAQPPAETVRGSDPDAPGPHMCPARGPVETFQPRRAVRTEAGNTRDVRDGHMGRDALRVADVFSRMEDQARRSHAKSAAKGTPFVPPFTVEQVSTGRYYAALMEWADSAGIKCASLDSIGGGSGANGQREAAIVDDLAALRSMQRRLAQRRVIDKCRPSKGGMAKLLTLRVLVDAVCVGQKTLSEVARDHGVPKNGRVIKMLQTAMGSALDDMYAFSCATPQQDD